MFGLDHMWLVGSHILHHKHTPAMKKGIPSFLKFIAYLQSPLGSGQTISAVAAVVSLPGAPLDVL